MTTWSEAIEQVRERLESKPPAWMDLALREVVVALWLDVVDLGEVEVEKVRAALGRGVKRFEIDYSAQDEMLDIVGDRVTFLKFRTRICNDHVAVRDGHGAPEVYCYPRESGGVLCTTERIESPSLREYIACALDSGSDVPECWMLRGFTWRRYSPAERHHNHGAGVPERKERLPVGG